MPQLIAVRHGDTRVNIEDTVQLYMNAWYDVVSRECNADSEELHMILRDQILTRLQAFPDGQIAIIDRGTLELNGTIYSMVYNSSQLSEINGWNGLTGNGYGTTHNPNGNSLICYAVQTAPGSNGIARMLVEAELELARNLGARAFVFTRPNGFSTFAEHHKMPPNDPESIEKYLHEIENGLVIGGDAVSLHTHLGAKLAPLLMNGKPYLENSRPYDFASAGYNVLMEYQIMK